LFSFQLVPKAKQQRGARRRVSQNKSSGDGRQNVDRLLAVSHFGGESAKRVTVKEDYISSQLSTILSQSPPKNLTRMTHWFQCQVTKANAIGVSTSVYTESNLYFALSDTPISANITGLFDQYCIYAVIVNICHSQIASANYLGRFTSAIDYDSVTNLGTEAGIQSYSTAQTVEVTQGLTVQRFIKPCVDSNVYSSSYANGRLWIDTSSGSSCQHFGLRQFWYGNTSTALLVDVLCTYIIGARNSF
jgi:hypothetical protein